MKIAVSAELLAHLLSIPTGVEIACAPTVDHNGCLRRDIVVLELTGPAVPDAAWGDIVVHSERVWSELVAR